MGLKLGQGISAAAYAEGEIAGKMGLMDAQAMLEEKREARADARALRLAELKARMEAESSEKARKDQTARIESKAGEIADGAIAGKRGLMDSGVVDRANWTAEQQAAVDQSLKIDRQALMDDPKTRTAAAIATGDISPKDAATLTQRDEAALYKVLWEREKEEGRNKRADDRIAASMESSDKRLAYLFAALEKKGGSGDGTNREALAFLDGSRKEIASEEATLKALYQNELASAPKLPEEQAKIKATYAPKFAEIERRRRLIESDYETVRERVGLPARAGATPTPPPPGKPGNNTRPPLSDFQR